jgi:hypothetical protein
VPYSQDTGKVVWDPATALTLQEEYPLPHHSLIAAPHWRLLQEQEQAAVCGVLATVYWTDLPL